MLEIYPVPENNEQVSQKNSKLHVLKRVAYYTAAGSVALTAHFIGQNYEEVSAAYEFLTYEAPEENDIIPDRTGCKLATQEEREVYFANNNSGEENMQDISFTALKGTQSVASKSSVPIIHSSSKDFLSRDKLIWPTKERYFKDKSDATTLQYTGLQFIEMLHTGNPEYTVNWNLANTYTEDLFENLDLYDHPDVEKLVTCFNNRYKSDEITSMPIEIGVLADPRLCLDGDAVARLSEFQLTSDCHSIGLGSPEIDVDFMNIYTFIDNRHMIIPGAVNNPNDFSDVLNKRFMHEMVHILFFDDLSDFAAEMDEQERFVDYVTDKMIKFYQNRDGAVPKFIEVL